MGGAPRVLADAVGVGLASGQDVHAGETSVRPVPRSNLVHRIDRRGRAVAYAKAAGAASHLDGDDTVAVETTVLERLGHEGFTPSLVPGVEGAGGSHGRREPASGDRGTVWTLAVDGVELGEVRRLTGGDAHAFARRIGERLGERLGDFHRLPQLTFPRRAPRPWPLGTELLPSMEAVPRNDELEEVLDAWFEPGIRAALDRARGTWDRRCSPVHGDLSAHNVIVGTSADVDITFLDLEACGLGDPSWDIVSLLRSLGESLADPGLEDAARLAFLAAYARRTGTGVELDAGFACARALATAWQSAAHPETHVRSRARTLLGEARRAAGRVAVAS